MDLSFIVFSFTAGIIAFFAPCSFALLPGYLSYYITNHSPKPNMSSIQLALRGIRFGLIASIGFFVVFGLSAGLVLSLGQSVRQFIPWIAGMTGVLIAGLGIFSLLGKEMTLFQMPIIRLVQKKEWAGVFLFGIAYAMGSLGCVFPLFLSMVIEAISASFVEGSLIVLAYIAAMSLLMIVLTTIAFSTNKMVFQTLERYIPLLKKIGAIVLIVAGSYMAYYQFSYLF